MKRDPRLYLEDILAAITAIDKYTEGLTRHEFDQDQLIQDAVLRRLEIIGEATRQIPKELLDQFPQIPWRQIAGIRNRLTHEYFGIILDRVWKVLREDLIPLKEAVIRMKDSLS